MRTPKFFKRNTEQQIITRFIEGDEQAFAYLFNQYWQIAYTLCFRYTKCHSDAEDVTQEVFKTLWEKRNELNIHSNFESYLIRSTKNRILNYFRAQQSKQYHEEMVARKAEVSESIFKTDFLLQAEKQHGYLVGRLPPRCREIYMLKYDESLTNQAVAEKMAVSIKTVEYHLQQAKKILRSKLLQNSDFL